MAAFEPVDARCPDYDPILERIRRRSDVFDQRMDQLEAKIDRGVRWLTCVNVALWGITMAMLAGVLLRL